MTALDPVIASREPVRHSTVTRIVIYGLLFLFALVYILPLAVMVMTSLKPLDEVTGGNMFALPKELTFYPWRRGRCAPQEFWPVVDRKGPCARGSNCSHQVSSSTSA